MSNRIDIISETYIYSSAMNDIGNWCLIESDLDVFIELIRGFGVKDVQIEELYCLDREQFVDLR